MTEIVKPIININGTAKEDLIDSLIAASAGVQKASDAMRSCMPNGRDYQSYGQHSTLLCDLARDRHTAEMRKLQEIGAYLQQMVVAIVGQE